MAECKCKRILADGSDSVWLTWLCPQCRSDLELGRLTRRMGLSSVLTREGPKLWNYYENRSDDEIIDRDGDTPEEALKGVGR